MSKRPPKQANHPKPNKQAEHLIQVFRGRTAQDILWLYTCNSINRLDTDRILSTERATQGDNTDAFLTMQECPKALEGVKTQLDLMRLCIQ